MRVRHSLKKGGLGGSNSSTSLINWYYDVEEYEKKQLAWREDLEQLIEEHDAEEAAAAEVSSATVKPQEESANSPEPAEAQEFVVWGVMDNFSHHAVVMATSKNDAITKVQETFPEFEVKFAHQRTPKDFKRKITIDLTVNPPVIGEGLPNFWKKNLWKNNT